jgi:acetylornithine deacetylase
MSAAGMLMDLIAISSVSSESNVPVIRHAQNVLRGWHFREQEYVDEYGVVKLNCVFSRDGRQSFELALVCHTDTVPYENASQVSPFEREGVVYGRGACDVKGYLACALQAIVDAGDAVCLILTADEEIGCVGARKLVDAGFVRARYAIIGEPTSLQPVRAGKGYCLAELKTHGREAHSAFPELGDSAIYRAARVIEQVERISIELKQDRDEAFDPTYTTVNIGTIHGGRAKNIVPSECAMLLEWRPIPGQPPERVPGMLTGCEVNILRMQAGFATPVSSRVVQVMQAISGRAAGSVSFGTEAPWMAKLGADAVVFGPGTMHVAHTREEQVPVAELEGCVEMLRRAVSELDGGL